MELGIRVESSWDLGSYGTIVEVREYDRQVIVRWDHGGSDTLCNLWEYEVL